MLDMNCVCNRMDHLSVLPLHKHKEYVSECVELLNSEWPRSETLRLKSIQTSCDSFPMHLVMVYKIFDRDVTCADCCKRVESFNHGDNDDLISKERNLNLNCLALSPDRKEIVVGHGKISKLWSVPDGCFIESVIIHKEYRGKGWGKLLMEKVELFIKRLGGVKFVFLTTVDKQSFYSKIGYKATKPIPLFGGSSSDSYDLQYELNQLLISTRSGSLNSVVSCGDFKHSCNFLRSATTKTKSRDLIVSTATCYTNSKHNNTGLQSTVPPPPPPPPPPLVPRFGKQLVNGHLVNSRKTFMVKVIT